MAIKIFAGWELNKEPLPNDVLSININGTRKVELLAIFVYKKPGHSFINYGNYIKISDEDNVEFLLNNELIPNWVHPIYLVKDKIKKKNVFRTTIN